MRLRCSMAAGLRQGHGRLRSALPPAQMSRANTLSSTGEQPTGSTARPPPGGTPSRQLATVWQGAADIPTGGSAPAALAGAAAGAVAGAVAGARMYQPSAEEARNDYTVLPIDLSRWVVMAVYMSGVPGGLACAGNRQLMGMCQAPCCQRTTATMPVSSLTCRYAATAGNEGDSIPLQQPARRSPLPTSFSQQLSGACLVRCMAAVVLFCTTCLLSM